MEIIQLKGQSRPDVGKRSSKDSRKKNFVPAVIYGKNETTKYAELDEHDLKTLIAKHGESVLIDLSIDNEPPILTIMKDVQHHPVTERVLHVDFKHIPRDKPVEIAVPIEYYGESKGVKSGGLFMPRLHEINIRAIPDRIPEKISIDISELDFGKTIHVKDIKLGEDIHILDSPDQTVATVVKQKVIVEAKAGEEAPEEGEEGKPKEETKSEKE